MEPVIDLLIILIKSFVVLAALLNFALLTIWLERKASALIQDRVGANRAAFFGFDLAGVINTVVADPVKAIFKEDWVPKGVSQFMHSLAPFLAVFPVILSFAVIPIGPSFEVGGREISLQLAALDMAVLYVFAMGSLAVYGTVLAGWASRNKFALLGGLRATAQMVSYEITMGLSVLGLLAVYETLDLSRIVEAQSGMFLHVFPRWGVFLNPIGFVLFFVSMFAETKRAPFDLPESESELVAGYLTEYSGMKFLLFWLGEFSEIVVVAAVVTVLFFGGWQVPGVDLRDVLPNGWASAAGAAVFFAKVAFFCLLQVVVRWTLPRFRYDQLMGLCWKLMLPLALLNFIGTAALVVGGFYR